MPPVLDRGTTSAPAIVVLPSPCSRPEVGFNDDRDEITFNQEKKAWERITKPQKGEPVKNKDDKPDPEEVAAQLSQEDQDVLNYGRRMMDDERKART